MEVNNSHVTYIGNSKKKCDINTFTKDVDMLFDGLKIIINGNGHMAPITNYKILCYIIYINKLKL